MGRREQIENENEYEYEYEYEYERRRYGSEQSTIVLVRRVGPQLEISLGDNSSSCRAPLGRLEASNRPLGSLEHQRTESSRRGPASVMDRDGVPAEQRGLLGRSIL